MVSITINRGDLGQQTDYEQFEVFIFRLVRIVACHFRSIRLMDTLAIESDPHPSSLSMT